MHSDPALEERPVAPVQPVGPARPDRRRKRGAGRPQEGPVFVDASGRRARLLRRAGMVLGVVTLGYVAVLGLAFMGGISLSPSQMLPFDGGPAAAEGGTGYGPPGGAPPPGAGEAPPTAQTTLSPSPSASASTGSDG
ncbi:hypothetical protein [Streptomyces sp. NPDC059092]|uniref:hypothetical protein n=1 Tax=Streptomyces sp. NPDC059092 TaxID=3346725 RepID=UPI00367685AE